MRAVILLLIVAVLVVIAGVASGYLKINQTRAGRGRRRSRRPRKGVTAKGGQAPAFDVETGSVKVGTKETTVRVPVARGPEAGAGPEPGGGQQRQ